LRRRDFPHERDEFHSQISHGTSKMINVAEAKYFWREWRQSVAVHRIIGVGDHGIVDIMSLTAERSLTSINA